MVMMVVVMALVPAVMPMMMVMVVMIHLHPDLGHIHFAVAWSGSTHSVIGDQLGDSVWNRIEQVGIRRRLHRRIRSSHRCQRGSRTEQPRNLFIHILLREGSVSPHNWALLSLAK